MEDIFILIFLVLLIFLTYFKKHKNAWFNIRNIRYIEDLLRLTPRAFEFFCADYLKAHGYKKIKVTPAASDGGKDIVCFKNGIRYDVECKKWNGCVGRPIIQKLYGCAISDHAKGIVITTGYYSRQAREFANINDVMLIGKVELVKFLKHNRKIY